MNTKINNLALLLVAPLPVMAGTILMAAIPSIAIHFQNVANAKLLSQLILAIPFISIAIFAPFVYKLTNALGEKKTFIYALIYIALLGALTGMLNNIYFILVARLFFGFGIATISSIFLSLIGDYFEGHRRNLFLGYQSSFTFLMGASFTMLGSFVGEYSWRYCFYLYMIIFVVVFSSLFFLKFKEPLLVKRKPMKLELIKKYFHIFFFAFLLKLLFYVFSLQIPFLLIEKGLKADTGYILSTLFIFAVFSSSMYGFITRIIPLKSILILCLLLKALSYFMIAVSQNIWLFFIATIFGGIATGLLHINLIKWFLDQIPKEYKLQGSSILTASMHCGFFISPIIFYPLINTFGSVSSFWVSCMILIMAALYLHVKMK